MKIIKDLKAYGIDIKLENNQVVLKGLDKIQSQDKQAVLQLVNEAKAHKDEIKETIKDTPIKASNAFRCEINKAFNQGEPIEHISTIMIRCIAAMTGDSMFEDQNLRRLRDKY